MSNDNGTSQGASQGTYTGVIAYSGTGAGAACSWAKWDGAWVVRGTGAAPAPGAVIQVTKRSGVSQSCTVRRVVLNGTTDQGAVWLASVSREQGDQGASYGRARYPRARYDEADDHDYDR